MISFSIAEIKALLFSAVRPPLILAMNENLAVRERPAAYEIVAFVYFTEDHLREVTRGARCFAVNARNPFGYAGLLATHQVDRDE